MAKRADGMKTGTIHTRGAAHGRRTAIAIALLAVVLVPALLLVIAKANSDAAFSYCGTLLSFDPEYANATGFEMSYGPTHTTCVFDTGESVSRFWWIGFEPEL